MSEENVDIVATPIYDPAISKRPPITVGVSDEPLVYVCVNRKWATVIVDALSRYAMTDAWSGTDDEKYEMQSAVSHIMAMFGYEEDCLDCERVLECVTCESLADCFDGPWREIIREIIREIGGEGATDDQEAATDADDLDCVWAACIGTLDFMYDEIEEVLKIVEASVQALDAIGDMVGRFTKYLPPIPQGAGDLWVASENLWEFIATVGVAAIRLFLTQERKENWACELFCSVVGAGGPPYRLTRVIWRAWIESAFSGGGIEAVVRFMFYKIDVPLLGEVSLISESYLFSRYRIMLGDNCNDDWEVLCVNCGPGALVETITLPSSRQTPLYSTFIANSGNTYTIRVIGDPCWSDTCAVRYDGSYQTLNNWSTHNPCPLAQNPTVDGDYTGLNINGTRPNGAPLPYNPGHEYDFVYTGFAGAFKFWIYDSDYDGNSGSYTIQIYESPGI